LVQSEPADGIAFSCTYAPFGKKALTAGASEPLTTPAHRDAINDLNCALPPDG
jgi:hypothetical protein